MFADFLKIKQRNFVFGGGHIINYCIIKFYTNLFFKELYNGKLTFLKLNLKKIISNFNYNFYLRNE
jgi:hypothetical protein